MTTVISDDLTPAIAFKESSNERCRSIPYIVRCLSDHLSPMPVSIRIFSPAPSMKRQFIFMRMRFCSSGGATFAHRLRGTTPNIAPPSSRNSQSGIISTRYSPNFIGLGFRVLGLGGVPHAKLPDTQQVHSTSATVFGKKQPFVSLKRGG